MNSVLILLLLNHFQGNKSLQGGEEMWDGCWLLSVDTKVASYKGNTGAYML